MKHKAHHFLTKVWKELILISRKKDSFLIGWDGRSTFVLSMSGAVLFLPNSSSYEPQPPSLANEASRENWPQHFGTSVICRI
jgi:hypothetical protein